MLRTTLAALTIAASLVSTTSAQTYWDTRPFVTCGPGKWGVESVSQRVSPINAHVTGHIWAQTVTGYGGSTVVVGGFRAFMVPNYPILNCTGFVDPSFGLFTIGTVNNHAGPPIIFPIENRFLATQRHQLWIYVQGFLVTAQGIQPLDVWQVEWPLNRL